MQRSTGPDSFSPSLTIAGSRLRRQQHPQGRAPVPSLVDRHIENVDAIGRVIYQGDDPTGCPARLAAVAPHDDDRAMAGPSGPPVLRLSWRVGSRW